MSDSACSCHLIRYEACSRSSVPIDQLLEFDMTSERRTDSRVVRSLREFASPIQGRSSLR
jgi:hypothetical protein